MSTSQQIIVMQHEKEWFYGLIEIVFYVVCAILFSLLLDKQNMEKYAQWPDECTGRKLRVAYQWYIDFSFSLLT